MCNDNINFWIFPLDNWDWFYSEHTDNTTSLYYILYIEKCMQDLSDWARRHLYLKDGSLLFVAPYLIPIYNRLPLIGYVIVIAEAYFTLNEYKALLKLSFSHVKPKGIINLGNLNESRKKCMGLLYMEYCSPNNDMQASMLNNLLVNMVFLSSAVDCEGRLKSGHMLNTTLLFMELINNFAVREKKINFYTARIGITEKMLRESLLFIYHKTFRDILTSRILIETMKLLVFSDKSITQIAHELDYDVSNFIRFFSSRKGIHPKDLRISCRNIINEIENGC